MSQHIEALRHYFAALNEIALAHLFGSYTRGQAGPLSDVDFAVLLAGHPDEDHCFETRLGLTGGLIELLHANEVDVLILNQAPPALRYAVLRDGIPIFCRDQQASIEFRVRTINDYLDFKPMLKCHGDAILKKA